MVEPSPSDPQAPARQSDPHAPTSRQGSDSAQTTPRTGAASQPTAIDPGSGSGSGSGSTILLPDARNAKRPPTPLPTPKRWGDFELLQELGRGGMGVVWRARQVSLGREVALKLMLREADAEFRLRFQREARALAQVDSPHVVKVHVIGEHDGQPFFVMEYLVGEDLSKKIRSGWRATQAEAIALTLQAARGLSAAAERGIIHRDIKPANLMITTQGVLKLMDFGLVRMATEQELTTSGTVLGTVQYFSPEQGRGERCDRRSDIYSLGVVFYLLVTGRLPFTGDSTAALIYQHVHAEPPKPRSVERTVPPALEAVIMRCLRKDPAERYQDAGELAADLERLQSGVPVQAGRHRSWPLVTAGAAAFAVVAGALVAATLWKPTRRDAVFEDPPAAHASPAIPVAPPPTPTQVEPPMPAKPIEATAAATIAPAPKVAPTPPPTPAATEPPPAVAEANPAPAPVAVPPAEPGKPPRPPGLGEVARDPHGWYADLVVGTERQRFRWCAPGTFLMGSPEGEALRDREEVQHRVTLSNGFWIADTECTQALWKAVMGTNPSSVLGVRLPVNRVSRDDCQRFCAKLAEQAPGLRARLPWEAEWEYACRAGGNEPFPNRMKIDAKAGCFDDTAPRPVASYPSNDWGLHDLIGNVSEWCADAGSDYGSDPVNDPHPQGGGPRGIARGGFWEDPPGACRSAKRAHPWLNTPVKSLGLRLVVDAADQKR